MKKILILSGPSDFHAFAVREALRAKGAEVTIWHTPDFPALAGESVRFERGVKTISIDGPELHLVDPQFDAVWRRRPSYSIDWSVIDPSDRRFVEGECWVFRRSLLSLLAPGAFWVNSAEAANRASYKMVQHELASALGIKTPDTLYSNDPKQIREFIRSHGGRIVYKPLWGLPWQSETSVWMSYTSELTEELLVADGVLRSTPGIFQELISKAFELRVTVMGQCLLTAKIPSQSSVAGQLDWRRAPDQLRVEACQLPAEIADQCLALMKALGIVFGCFDFIVTPEGEYIFLEVNEMGQFLFLEADSGLPLLDRFSDFLLHGRADFEGAGEGARIRYPEVVESASAASEAAMALHRPAPDWFSNDEPEAPC